VRVDGYRVKAGDMRAVFRPRLRNCPSKHYHPLSGKAEPAVEMGLCVDVGKVDQQIVPLPALLIQPQLSTAADAPSSTSQTKQQLIRAISLEQEEDAVYLFDSEFKAGALLEAGIQRFVVCLAVNCVLRRNHLPANSGNGRPPEEGEEVRLLARRYKDHTIPATPCDESFTRFGIAKLK
jgi:hypothetical protein